MVPSLKHAAGDKPSSTAQMSTMGAGPAFKLDITFAASF